MTPPAFYDLSFAEWSDAIRGYRQSLGIPEDSGLAPATDADFEGWDPELLKPTPSVAA